MDRYKHSRQSTRRSRRKSPIRILDTYHEEEDNDWNVFSRRPVRAKRRDWSSEMEGTAILNRYKLEEYIGHGSFGNVYRGTDLKTLRQIAAKTEPIHAKLPQLQYEYRVYNLLKGGVGIPNAYWLGQYEDNTILIMELLGENLQHLRSKHTFSLCTVLILADQMLRRIEHVHNHGLVYRDVKPDNFVMGVGALNRRVYLLDYGLAKRYVDANGNHIRPKRDKHLVGTARYSSIHSHMRYELGRRDDLEALGYLLLYLLWGQLPWQGIQADSREEKYNLIGAAKIETPLEELCKGIPYEFVRYLRYCRKMAFTEVPDYQYLRGLFRSIMIRMRFRYDAPFEWQ